MRVIIAIFALGVLIAVNVAVANHDEPTCTEERISSLQGGLSYVNGYRAALVALGEPTDRADHDIDATQQHLAACGV